MLSSPTTGCPWSCTVAISGPCHARFPNIRPTFYCGSRKCTSRTPHTAKTAPKSGENSARSGTAKSAQIQPVIEGTVLIVDGRAMFEGPDGRTPCPPGPTGVWPCSYHHRSLLQAPKHHPYPRFRPRSHRAICLLHVALFTVNI